MTGRHPPRAASIRRRVVRCPDRCRRLTDGCGSAREGLTGRGGSVSRSRRHSAGRGRPPVCCPIRAPRTWHGRDRSSRTSPALSRPTAAGTTSSQRLDQLLAGRAVRRAVSTGHQAGRALGFQEGSTAVDEDRARSVDPESVYLLEGRHPAMLHSRMPAPHMNQSLTEPFVSQPPDGASLRGEGDARARCHRSGSRVAACLAQSWQLEMLGVAATVVTERRAYTPPQHPQRCKPGTAARIAGRAIMNGCCRFRVPATSP